MLLPLFAFSENFPQLLRFYVPVDGGVVVGGTSPVAVNWVTYVPAGGVKVGGTSPVDTTIILIHEITPAGGVKVGGSAVVSHLYVTVHEITPIGGVKVGGSAVVLDHIPIVPTGGVKLGGRATIQEGIRFTPTGGVKVGGTARWQGIINETPTGGVAVGGAATVLVAYRQAPSGGVKVGGGAEVSDYQAWHAPSGGVKVGGTALAYMLPSGAVVTTENPYSREFPGWAVNYETNVPTRYARLPANSFCRFNGKTYVANAGGIYEVGADDDAGQPIRASVDFFGLSDFGSPKDKRIPAVYLALRSVGPMRLAFETNAKEGRSYYTVNRTEKLRVTKVVPGRGIHGRYYRMELSNMEGGDFELESNTFTPVLNKRYG